MEGQALSCLGTYPPGVTLLPAPSPVACPGVPSRLRSDPFDDRQRTGRTSVRYSIERVFGWQVEHMFGSRRTSNYRSIGVRRGAS